MTEEKTETKEEQTEEVTDEELKEALLNVYKTLAERQQPLGEPFESILYSNRWKLYE